MNTDCMCSTHTFCDVTDQHAEICFAALTHNPAGYRRYFAAHARRWLISLIAYDISRCWCAGLAARLAAGADLDMARRDQGLLIQLEETLEVITTTGRCLTDIPFVQEWSSVIVGVIDREMHKKPEGQVV